MTTRPIYLIDQDSDRVADLDVSLVGDLYRGTISLDATPPQLKHLFEEFEELVEGQVFNLADEIEEKIGEYSLRVVYANGSEVPVDDLQVYPSTKRVSFKTRQVATLAAPGNGAAAGCVLEGKQVLDGTLRGVV